MGTFMIGNKQYIEHTVLAGETASGIAEANLGAGKGARWVELVKENQFDGHPPISQYPHVYTGQVIGYPNDYYVAPVIQPVHASYTVQQGDTLQTVAAAHNMSLDEFLNLNPNLTLYDIVHQADVYLPKGHTYSVKRK